MKASGAQLGKLLLEWYLTNHRKLPWRENRDPYRIWISETMLQQTTVVAVIPYFERFIARFPNVDTLAQAPLELVLEHWAGLGYYSRARNLHKAAQILAKNGFSRSYLQLMELPGFGPYTSRAVSSIAFDEAVGVLDGNVIRVLSRVYGINSDWWTTKARDQLQHISDELVQKTGTPHLINQALMELGATICTPKKTLCLLCPWKGSCQALAKKRVEELPKKKPRRHSEIWYWRPLLALKKDSALVCSNSYAPFLKGQLIFPGTVEKLSKKPKAYDLKHSITHHSIYIKIDALSALSLKSKSLKKEFGDLQWIPISELKKLNPSSMLTKILQES